MAQKYKLCIKIALFAAIFSELSLGVRAQGATLSLSPASGSFGVGDEFSVAVRVHTGGTFMNAAEATINFPPDLLGVVSISKSGSIFSLWTVEPTFSGSGIVTFAGGTPGTFSGSSGTLATINFRAKKEGEAQVTFSSARILAADGQGTNIFGGASGASYSISAAAVRARPTPGVEVPVTAPSRAKPKIISLTHPDEGVWYKNLNPEFSWALPEDATAVSFLLDRIPERDPDSRSEGLVGNKLYSDVEEGVKYFHLKVKNAYGWSEISHYRIQIDRTPPRPFEITVLDGKETTNPQPTILFDTTDSISGVEYYEVKIGNDKEIKTEGDPFKIARQIPGTYTIIVKAFDKALNFSQAISEVIIKPIETPVVSEFNSTLFLGENLTIKGRGIPGSSIELYMNEKERAGVAASAVVDKSGEWFLSSDRFYINGSYSFYAIQEDESGGRSLPTDPYFFKIYDFVKIGPFKIPGIGVILILIIAFLAVLFTSFLTGRKIQSIRRGVRYEASDAKKKLHRSMDQLKEQITEQKLKDDLDKLELSVEKEIKDIEGGANHESSPRRPLLASWIRRWEAKIKRLFLK